MTDKYNCADPREQWAKTAASEGTVMQQRMAQHVLAELQRCGWTQGIVIRQRPGVYDIAITTPKG